ncbi:hypothetical protein [Thermus sp. CCB_US3_UF1]|nr:hypothetical protein [Thermus sp. CCB_US3_UF1]
MMVSPRLYRAFLKALFLLWLLGKPLPQSPREAFGGQEVRG